MRAEAPRIMVAGTASGVGKTVVTCVLLRLLTARGLRVQACKAGPDYLDPTFHEQVLGVPSRNLDLFLAGEDLVRDLVFEGAHDHDLTLVEGTMGYYDGMAGGDGCSAWHLARASQTPCVLVVDARGRSLSAAAELSGFLRFREPSQIAGVIVNRASAGAYPRLKEAIERETGVTVVGYLPRLDDARLRSRHLGLVDAAEVADLADRVDRMAALARDTIDVEALLALARQAPPLVGKRREPVAARVPRVPIALARDAAFSFYYRDGLDLLERLGARLIPFSPLADEGVPAEAAGLYLGGGYPELHARLLSANSAMRASIGKAIRDGMPTIAECGGYLYLHRTLEDENGVAWPMVGMVDGHACKGTRLGNFGYATLVARHDGLLARAGESLRCHEFHYWRSDAPQDAFCLEKPGDGRRWQGGTATPTLHAGFPHLYLPGCPEAARRFVDACDEYGRARAAGHGEGA